MKKLFFLFMIIAFCSCGGKKEYRAIEFKTVDARGNVLKSAYAFDVVMVIDDDLIYSYTAGEIDDEKFSIYETNEKLNETEYLFVDRKGVTGTLVVPRFGDEMTIDYEGEIVKIKFK